MLAALRAWWLATQKQLWAQCLPHESTVHALPQPATAARQACSAKRASRASPVAVHFIKLLSFAIGAHADQRCQDSPSHQARTPRRLPACAQPLHQRSRCAAARMSVSVGLSPAHSPHGAMAAAAAVEGCQPSQNLWSCPTLRCCRFPCASLSGAHPGHQRWCRTAAAMIEVVLNDRLGKKVSRTGAAAPRTCYVAAGWMTLPVDMPARRLLRCIQKGQPIRGRPYAVDGTRELAQQPAACNPRARRAVPHWRRPQIRVKCNEDDTIGDLKKMVAAQTGAPLPAQQRASCARPSHAGLSPQRRTCLASHLGFTDPLCLQARGRRRFASRSGTQVGGRVVGAPCCGGHGDLERGLSAVANPCAHQVVKHQDNKSLKAGHCRSR